MNLTDLPRPVVELLDSVKAPPRLTAHLTLVHDAAVKLVRGIRRAYPGLLFDEEAVLFGAATHDIGKALLPAELTGRGSTHEERGAEILTQLGIPDSLARFARTHGSWKSPDATLEDLLVSLADKIWKGARQDDLEMILVGRISRAISMPEWEVFSALDTILFDLEADADARLAWQSKFPVT